MCCKCTTQKSNKIGESFTCALANSCVLDCFLCGKAFAEPGLISKASTNS